MINLNPKRTIEEENKIIIAAIQQFCEEHGIYFTRAHGGFSVCHDDIGKKDVGYFVYIGGNGVDYGE